VLMNLGRVVADGSAAQVKALAGGRVLRANLPPGADRTGLTAMVRLSGVDSVQVRGDTVIVRGRNTDAAARHLLNSTAARDLEITSHNLEEAFLTLTADDTARSSR